MIILCMELTQIILHNLTLSELKDYVRSVLSGMFNLSVYEHIVATITLMTDYKLHTIRQPWWPEEAYRELWLMTSLMASRITPCRMDSRILSVDYGWEGNSFYRTIDFRRAEWVNWTHCTTCSELIPSWRCQRREAERGSIVHSQDR